MNVIVVQDTAGADPDDPVVEHGTIGEVVGDGWGDERGHWIAVDFGNIVMDVRIDHVKVTP